MGFYKKELTIRQERDRLEAKLAAVPKFGRTRQLRRQILSSRFEECALLLSDRSRDKSDFR